jgi:MFS family permease
MGIITSGVYIGIGITLLGGGFLIDYLTQIGGINLPLIGYLKPWQATFMIVGIPGLILALAAFLLKEPKRIDEQVNLDKAIERKNIFLHLKEHKRTLIPMFGGLIFMALIFYSFSFWAPTMMIRAFDISLSEVGLILGVITIISSIIGTILAGTAVDYLRNKNYADAPVRAAMIAVMLALPPIVLLSFVNTELGAWICIALYLLFISSFAPLGLLAISGVSTGNVKGQAAAIHAFLMMAFGLSLGPQLTAFFTDYIFANPNLLINSISLSGLIVLPISALLFKISLPRYRESSKRVLA